MARQRNATRHLELAMPGHLSGALQIPVLKQRSLKPLQKRVHARHHAVDTAGLKGQIALRWAEKKQACDCRGASKTVRVVLQSMCVRLTPPLSV